MIQVLWGVSVCRSISGYTSYWTLRPLKVKALHPFETSTTTDPATGRHIPEDLNLRCENLKSPI